MNTENLSPETVEKIDTIVDAQFDGDTTKREDALNRALDVYRPFTNEKVNPVLKDISRVLVAMEEIPEATEAEMVNYALKGLLHNYVQAAKHRPTRETPGDALYE